LEIQIRSCREADLRKVTEIEDLSFDDPYPYRLFVSFLFDYPDGFRVATSGNAIVGYCILSFSSKPETLIISSIAVHPDFRRHGIGGMLLSDSLRIGRELSALGPIKKIILQVAAENSPAQSLYATFGFHTVRKLPDYYGPGKDGIQMELDFSNHG
jgi:[ribosomal protein S18]-alanine N-acetyltransferase